MKTRSNLPIKAPRADRSQTSRSIELHVGELVLHGFSQADRRPIAESIEHELRALLTRDELSVPNSLHIEQINGGSFEVQSPQRHQSVGANIARAIYGGLRQ